MNESTDLPAHRRFPRSAYDRTSGLLYFARMLDKIRLYHAGQLPEEYHPFLGQGFDGRMCRFLRIEYSAVRERTAAGGDDAAVLEWCYEHGRRPSDEDVEIFNKYQSKFGWRDEDNGATGRLETHKAAGGFAGRADILTFFDFYEVDEKRRP